MHDGNFSKNAKLTIDIKKTHNEAVFSDSKLNQPEIIDSFSIVTDGNGFYNHSTTVIESGRYQIFTNILASQFDSKPSFTSYSVKSIFLIWPAVMLYEGVAFFIALIIIILRGQKIAEAANVSQHDDKMALIEIIRFVCVTGIASSFMLALLFSDVEIGANSPVGSG